MADVDVSTTIGALFVGGTVMTALWGISTVQCYVFFDKFADEGRLLRWSVLSLWFLDTCHLVVTLTPLYSYMVLSMSKPITLDVILWGVPSSIMVSTLTIVIVNGWYIYRVWILSRRNTWSVLPLGLLIFAALMSNLVLSARLFMLRRAEQTVSDRLIDICFYFGLSTAVVVDFAIATTLCYHLYRGKSPLNSRTNTFVRFFIIYTINTGLLITILRVGTIIARTIDPLGCIFIAMYSCLSGVHVNSLLGSLNARDWFRIHDDHAMAISFGIPSGIIYNPNGKATLSGNATEGATISDGGLKSRHALNDSESSMRRYDLESR